MHNNFRKYLRPSVYYSSRSGLQKRWHRAVKSHSPFGPSNPNAFSRYIRNESTMGHIERKSFKLPCGKTLAQSWGALRKAWLGFKIAHSNDDYFKMREYAHIIRKLQLQMGIQVTIFDESILNEQEDIDPVVQYLGSESECKQENQDYPENDPTSELDGDIIMHTPIPDPRHEIFLRRLEKSCPYQTKPPATVVQKHVIDYSKSCQLDRQSPDEQTAKQAEKGTIYYDRSCNKSPKLKYRESSGPGDSTQEKIDSKDSFEPGILGRTSRRKKSCWYKAKEPKSCYYKADSDRG